jgi:hypothetical protein
MKKRKVFSREFKIEAVCLMGVIPVILGTQHIINCTDIYLLTVTPTRSQYLNIGHWLQRGETGLQVLRPKATIIVL